MAGGGVILLDVDGIRAALQAADVIAPFPAGIDRAGVASLRAGIGEVPLEALLATATADLDAPIPALPASLYHDFARTGRREPYEDAQRARRNMLYRLVLAEYLEWSGALMDRIEDLLWARLEETNWAWPAHAHSLDEVGLPTLDLAAAMTALDLAEMDHLLGARLDPVLRRRLRHEVGRRVIRPFVERDHWWLHPATQGSASNWTAVCIGGAVGAACYFEEDIGQLAEIVARGLAGLDEYLSTFGADGGSTEGPDYWSYGFGNFVVLAHLLACRTGGRIDLLKHERVRKIAAFPLRTMLAPGLWVSFSDSDATPQLFPALLTRLSREPDLGDLARLGIANDFRVAGFNQFAWPLRQYAWPLPGTREPFVGTERDWFPDMTWLIARHRPADPRSLRLAVKGGHNDEMHNHNDVGSFVVASGGRLLLTDPGRGRYSKDYFGPDRYRNVMASSRGHSVPEVNGVEQAAGRAHAATVLEHETGAAMDRLAFEMAAAYPDDAGLESLVRRVTLERDTAAGRIELVDAYRFRDGPGRFVSALVTTASAEVQAGRVLVSDGEAQLELRFDPDAVDATLEVRRGVEKQYAPSVDLTRILLSPRRARREGVVRLIIAPAQL